VVDVDREHPSLLNNILQNSLRNLAFRSEMMAHGMPQLDIWHLSRKAFAHSSAVQVVFPEIRVIFFTCFASTRGKRVQPVVLWRDAHNEINGYRVVWNFHWLYRDESTVRSMSLHAVFEALRAVLDIFT
jgi:hypothetical protein